MLWLNPDELGLDGFAHVTGVRPKMDGDKMSMVLIKTSGQLVFVEVDYVLQKAKTSLITTDLLAKPFTIFMGTKTK